MRLGLLAAQACLWAAIPVCVSRAAEEGDAKPEAPIKKLARQLRPELLVSESPFIYLSTPDVKKALQAFERTAFMGMVNEDEVNAPILAAFGKLRDTYVKGDGTRSDAETKKRNEEVDLLLKIMPLLESQLALAVDLDNTGMAGLTAGKLPRFMLVSAMPPGDAGGERQGQIEDVLESYRGRLTIDARYHDFDTARNSYAIHGLDNVELGTFEAWAFVENLFIYAQGKGQIEDAIDRYTTKKGVGSLALNPTYQGAFKQVGRDEKGEALAYFQIDPKLVAADKIENEWAKLVIASIAGATSDGALPQIALGIQVGDGTNAPIREKLFVRGTDAKNAARALEGCKGNSARFVASDGLYYWAKQGNFADSFNALKESVSSMYGSAAQSLLEQRIQSAIGAKDPAEAAKKLELFKGEFSAFIEYAPRNQKFTAWSDLLSNFQVVLCMEIDRENVNYEAALKDIMSKLETGTGLPYVTTNASGTIIRYQRGAAPGEGPTGPLGLRANLDVSGKTTPFFSCWAKVDMDTDPGPVQRHFVLLSDDLPSMRKAMSQRSSPRTSLFEDAKFRDTLKSFRESRYHLAYLDTVKAVNIYSTLIPLVARAELVDREKLNKFPSAGALRPHLFPLVDADSRAPNGEGVLTEFSSPTGILPLAALITSVAWPEINFQRQRAISEEVDNRFKQIMLGLQLYAADFDRYPPQLSDLVGVGSAAYIDIKKLNIFDSPFNRGAVQSALDVDNSELSNLVYVPNRNMQDLGNDIMLYEKQPTRIERGENSKLLYHVMTVDGKIRGMPKAALDRALVGKFSSTTGGKSAGKDGTPPASAPVKPKR